MTRQSHNIRRTLRHRSIQLGSWCAAAVAGVAVVLGLGVGVAPAPAATLSAKVRLLTEGARSFGSDGVRYVVYVHHIPGELASSPLVIVDTAKGMSRRSVRLPGGCMVGTTPMTPGFLLACGRPEPVLVDLAHGTLVHVPSSFDSGGVPRFAEFADIGRQWLQGYVTCPDGKNECAAYENWHTGEQRIEGPVGVVRRDLDDPALGARPPACAPFQRAQLYESDGRYVLLRRALNLAIGRCGRADVDLLHPSGFGSATLAAGFVTWSGAATACSHTIYGYDIKQRRTTRWAVPRVTRKPSCGIVVHTAKAVVIGSSLTSLQSGEDTCRLYITRRP
jgi:hypothetical protein